MWPGHEGPVLVGDGVVLDQHRSGDVDSHVAGEDEETARRLGWWPHASTEETVRAAYERWATQWRTGDSNRTFAVRPHANGPLVGGCELRLHPDGRSAYVSWWTHAGERGKGYATRAVRALTDYARSLGVERLEAHVAEDNAASHAVARKAGFSQVDMFTEDDGTPMVRYELRLLS